MQGECEGGARGDMGAQTTRGLVHIVKRLFGRFLGRQRTGGCPNEYIYKFYYTVNETQSPFRSCLNKWLHGVNHRAYSHWPRPVGAFLLHPIMLLPS